MIGIMYSAHCMGNLAITSIDDTLTISQDNKKNPITPVELLFYSSY